MPVFHNDPDPVNPLARAPVTVGLRLAGKTGNGCLSYTALIAEYPATAATQSGWGRYLFDIGTDFRENLAVPFKIKNKLVEFLNRLPSNSRAGIKWWDYDHEV